MAIPTINLSGYKAILPSASGVLCLGTYNSYGIEQLAVERGPEWEGLTITAVFSSGGVVLAPPIVIPESNVFDVPPGATQNPLTTGKPGVLTFRGVSDGVQRISTSVYYLVANHGPVDGTAPVPTPSEWEQLVSAFQNLLNNAVPPDGTPGYVLGATENGNAWVPQTGGGGGGGTIVDDDTGTVYDAAVHIQNGYPVLILTERSVANG